MFGVDVAGYQKTMDFRREKFDFAIVKATEGYDYVSPSFRYFVDELTKLDKLIGVYHFARPDRHSSAAHIKREADHFVKTVKDAGLIGKAILVLDWETQPLMRPDFIKAFMERVEVLTGVTPFLYESRSVLEHPEMKEVREKYPVWMAYWPCRYSINPAEVGDFMSKYPPDKSSVDWKIWQFTDNGAWRGFPGTVDFDYTDMTPEQWRKYAGGKNMEDKKDTETLSSEMKWAIAYGLFNGYGDGKYGPNDYMTRDQCAKVLKRYTQILAESIAEAIKNS